MAEDTLGTKDNGEVSVGSLTIDISGLDKACNEAFKVISKTVTKINRTMSRLGKANAPTGTDETKGDEKGFSLSSFTSKLNAFTKKFNNSMPNISSFIRGTASFVSGRFLFSYGKKFADFAGTYVENINLIENAFGKNSKAVVSWAKDFSNSLGVSINQVTQFAGSFQSLIQTMIGVTDVGEKMSLTLTQLVYDVASLRNLEFSEAFNKIQSTVFGGQLKTSRFLGIDISTNALDELLKDLGMLNVRARDLSEAEKVYLRFIKTVQSLETTGAFGDLAETVSTVSNRIRILQGSWENLMTAIGSATSGVINKFLGALIGIIQALNIIVQTFWELPDETAFNNTALGIDSISDSVDELNESMGLLNIDKFNVLSSGSDSAGAGISAELARIAEEYADRYAEVADSFKVIDEEVANIKNGILQWLFPLGTVDEKGNFIVDDAKTLSNEIKTIGTIILAVVGALTSAKLVTGIANLVNAFTTISGALSTGANATNPVGWIILAITALVALYTKNEKFRESVNNLIKAFKPLIDKVLPKIVSIITRIVDILAPMLERFLDKVGSKLAVIIDKLTPFIEKAISQLADSLAVVLDIVEWLLKVIESIYEILKAIFSLNFSDLANELNRIWNGDNLISAQKSGGGGGGFGASGDVQKSKSFSDIIKWLFTPVWKEWFANSGIPAQGSLFFAGEGSRPELLYNANGRTNVVDSDILGETFYQAQMRANRASGGGQAGGVAKLYINGKELADATFKDFDYYSKRTTGRGLTNR